MKIDGEGALNLNLDEISIMGIKTSCHVGIYPREQNQAQPLEIDVTLYLDTKEAVRCNSLTKSVDYAALKGEISFILQSANFKLLETAAEALCYYILAPSPVDRPRGKVYGVELTLKKIRAFRDGSIPKLKIKRTLRDVSYSNTEGLCGEQFIIHKGHDGLIFRLIIGAQMSTPNYYHTGGVMSEMPCSAGVSYYTQGLAPGTGVFYPEGFVRKYINLTSSSKSLLCFQPPSSRVVVGKSLTPIDNKSVPNSMFRSYFAIDLVQQYF